MASDFAELAQFTVDPRSVRLLPPAFCSKRLVVVLGKVDPASDAKVTVGMLEPRDRELVSLVQQALSRHVVPVRLNEYEIRRALDIGFSRQLATEVHGERIPLHAVDRIAFTPGREVPAIVSDLLGHAVHAGASDIHIECYEGDVDVRLRIDGVLHQLGTAVSIENIDEVTARLKILAELDIAERRMAQDGRIMAVFDDGRGGKRRVDFRVSVVPGPFGEDTVLRILDGKPLVGLADLGFEADTLERFQFLVRNPEGLVFVTGPTGSGKTTTLYSALAEINSESNKVLTVEDPIEYHFPKANQKQVGTKMSFADYARSFMRQDPDIMLIGEIRDEETADIAVRAAQTGHLVLSTLHTNGSVGTIARLGVLGVHPGLVADTMLGALSQRLVRRVCRACAEPDVPSDFARWMFEKLGEEIPLIRGRGCPSCLNTGFKGRVGIYELFVVDEPAADLVARSAPAFEIRRFARSRGMRSLFEDGIRKIKLGLTTLDEVRSRVPHRMVTEALEGVSGE